MMTDQKTAGESACAGSPVYTGIGYPWRKEHMAERTGVSTLIKLKIPGFLKNGIFRKKPGDPGKSGTTGKYARAKTEERLSSDGKWNAGLLLALVTGIFFLAYPSAANYWNTVNQARAVMNYAAAVADMSTAEYENFIHAAEEYNKKLSRTGIKWGTENTAEEEYMSLLNINGTGIMGYIDIPKINIKLPIHHGISDEVLQTSIGHLPETSLPVGGASSHCVLSGHRGLPSAKLFSNLDKLVEGDVFTISVLNETYSYEVDRIRVVKPTELSELRIIPGQDLCTLVTCTPYGVNTHRLLVRGHRVANAQGNAKVTADAMQLEAAFVAPFLMAPMILVLLIILFVEPGKK